MNSFRNRENGKILLGVAGAMILVVIISITTVIGWYIYCESRKSYWDKQVDGMCMKDGGIKVFEIEKISLESYQRLAVIGGEIPIYSKSSAAIDAAYFTEEATIYFHENSPQVRRSETLYIKKTSNKILARYVYYSRVGGDFPTFAHPSYHGCAIPKNGITKQFIQVDGDSK